MTARYGDSHLRTYCFATGQNALNHRHGKFADWHANDRKRQYRTPAHRVNVRERIGGRYAAKVIWIVHDRREKIRSRYQRLRFIQLVDRRVIVRLSTNQQIWPRFTDRGF